MITEYNSSLVDVIELFECLPVIEQLAISLQCLIQGTVLPRELPFSLLRLKHLSLEGMCFVDNYGLPLLLLLIRSSPKLEKLKLQIDSRYLESEPDSQDCSEIWLARLIEVEIGNIGFNLKVELEFVKLILAKSPSLKKINVGVDGWADNPEELKKVEILLRSPRASPEVEIIVEYF